MNMKRAIWMSVLVHLASAFVGTVVGLVVVIAMLTTTGPDFFAMESEPSVLLQIPGVIISVGLAMMATWWYFKPKALKPSRENGFQFGLTVVLVGLVFDALFIIPLYLLAPEGEGTPLALLANPWIWGTIILVLVGTTFMGERLEKRA